MKSYIAPSKAYNQLKNAYELKTSVYIYGATGYGKTSLVSEFVQGKEAVWFSAKDEEWDLSAIKTDDGKAKNTCIIFDDAQFLDSDERKNTINQLIKMGDYWIVIIGRISGPQWMMPLVAEGLVRVISEKQLRLHVDEIKKLAEMNDVSLSEQEANAFDQYSDGNAYAIGAAIQLLVHGRRSVEEVFQTVNAMFVNHLETEIIPQWDMYLQEFLMMVSVVDEFSLDMAVMITGDDKAAALIDGVMNLGNFLTLEDGVYRMRPQLLEALRSRALKLMGLNEYRIYIANAAHYYEMHDNILMALKLYEKCENKDSIRALLIRNGRRHPGVGFYYELRKYYLSLEDEYIESTPVLMSAMSMLYSLLMNPEKSEYWYATLEAYAKKAKAGEKREADEQLLYLDLALPHRGSNVMQSAFKHAFTLMQGGKIRIPELSITNNGPSAMNGGKDFCDWSKKDKFMAETIGKMMEAVTGDMGRGLTHAGMAESILEKGTNDAEATHYATLLSLDVEGSGKYELMFVAVAVQVRIALLMGNTANAIKLVEAFEVRVSDCSNEALKRSLQAFKCRVLLVSGKIETAEEWLKTAPDDMMEFCVLDRYIYMTMAICFIQQEKYTEATEILTRLRYYAEEYKRTYIHMETGIYLSIISKRTGGVWEELFLSTLLEIQEYHFVRTISEKGAGVLPLLKDCKKDFMSLKGADAGWFAQVLKETEMMAKRYPVYLNCFSPQAGDFSDTDIKILQLQAEGLSTKEIAGIVFMSERTVKYHVSENYKKLGASGKVEAVQIAKSINLI